MQEEGYFAGQFLVAMPSMMDHRFERSVIYLCVHNAEGAMGLIVNKAIRSLSFTELLNQLGITLAEGIDPLRIHFGGPVEMGRGFVLHSADYGHEGNTLNIDDRVALTASLDIVHSLAKGVGPQRALVALGYAGWGPGQLDSEIQANGWLNAPADEDVLFDPEINNKWSRVIDRLGISPVHLSTEAGHA